MKPAWLLLLIFVCGPALAQDPFDPLDTEEPQILAEQDARKSADELLAEAADLMDAERLLDARTRLLEALRKDPQSYRAHLLLAEYYFVHVGHFRLSAKHALAAQQIFEERYGKPPYTQRLTMLEHAGILQILAQVRLNLDNYQGALDTLDSYARHGYTGDWFPGTKAWVLMKLGRTDDAIKVAQVGYLGLQREREKGHVLNMLGILLSMKRERSASIEVFRNAIAHELSLGPGGQPATPLNNVGEVYRETFEEDKAEQSWLRATSMPDGCEHVLPALNLAILYFEQMNISGAKKAIDNFEACVAQYPLRNGEEHRALVNLARGRIALLSGRPEQASELLTEALEKKQWFGKIGTSEADLQAGALLSSALALKAQANHLSLAHHESLSAAASAWLQQWKLRRTAKWYLRRARQILIEDADSFEDLFVRNTDSLLDYARVGTLAAGMPSRAFERRLEHELTDDPRTGARPYYYAYLGESMLHDGRTNAGMQYLNRALAELRAKYDSGLKLHILGVIAEYAGERAGQYREIAERVFAMNRGELRARGLRLPVNFIIDDAAMLEAFEKTPFLLDNTAQLQYLVKGEIVDGEYAFSFIPQSVGGAAQTGKIRVKSNHLREGINQLVNEVFVVHLQ